MLGLLAIESTLSVLRVGLRGELPTDLDCRLRRLLRWIALPRSGFYEIDQVFTGFLKRKRKSIQEQVHLMYLVYLSQQGGAPQCSVSRSSRWFATFKNRRHHPARIRRDEVRDCCTLYPVVEATSSTKCLARTAPSHAYASWRTWLRLCTMSGRRYSADEHALVASWWSVRR